MLLVTVVEATINPLCVTVRALTGGTIGRFLNDPRRRTILTAALALQTLYAGVAAWL